MPNISKNYERVMYLRLVGFFRLMQSLNNNEKQGFKCGKFVISANIDIDDSIVYAIDRGVTMR